MIDAGELMARLKKSRPPVAEVEVEDAAEVEAEEAEAHAPVVPAPKPGVSRATVFTPRVSEKSLADRAAAGADLLHMTLAEYADSRKVDPSDTLAVFRTIANDMWRSVKFRLEQSRAWDDGRDLNLRRFLVYEWDGHGADAIAEMLVRLPPPAPRNPAEDGDIGFFAEPEAAPPPKEEPPAEAFSDWQLAERYTPPSAEQTVRWWSEAAQVIRREQLNHMPLTLPESVASSPGWSEPPPEGFSRRVTVRTALDWIVKRERDLVDHAAVPSAERFASMDEFRARAEREAAVRFRVTESTAGGREVSLAAVDTWIDGRCRYLTMREIPPGVGYVPGPAEYRLQAEAEAEGAFAVYESAAAPAVE